jgi:hypothetical protein
MANGRRNGVGTPFATKSRYITNTSALLPIRIWIWIYRIHMFLGLPDPDPLVRGMDPDPDPSIIMQYFVTLLTFHLMKNDVNAPSKSKKQKKLC